MRDDCPNVRHPMRDQYRCIYVIVSPKKKIQQTFYFNKSEMVKIDREICILYKNIIMKK